MEKKQTSRVHVKVPIVSPVVRSKFQKPVVTTVTKPSKKSNGNLWVFLAAVLFIVALSWLMNSEFSPENLVNPKSKMTPTPVASDSLQTCVNFKDDYTGYGHKWDKERLSFSLPEKFPQPPEGSAICGTAPQYATVYYVTMAKTKDEVMEHYKTGLTAAGFTVTENNTDTTAVLKYDNGKLQNDAGFEGGTVTFYIETEGLSITYTKK